MAGGGHGCHRKPMMRRSLVEWPWPPIAAEFGVLNGLQFIKLNVAHMVKILRRRFFPAFGRGQSIFADGFGIDI